MKTITYYDKINKKKITVSVNNSVSRYINTYEKEQRQIAKNESGFILSLDKLVEDGFQPVSDFDVEKELSKEARERKYLNSTDYKKFRKSLNNVLRSKMDQMSSIIRTVMFLRFFKNMSISQIASVLHIQKSTAQTYISRGCSYIRKFLENDIQKQKQIEDEKKFRELLNSLKK